MKKKKKKTNILRVYRMSVNALIQPYFPVEEADTAEMMATAQRQGIKTPSSGRLDYPGQIIKEIIKALPKRKKKSQKGGAVRPARDKVWV